MRVPWPWMGPQSEATRFRPVPVDGLLLALVVALAVALGLSTLAEVVRQSPLPEPPPHLAPAVATRPADDQPF